MTFNIPDIYKDELIASMLFAHPKDEGDSDLVGAKKSLQKELRRFVRRYREHLSVVQEPDITIE